jgi:phosphotransferase system enzyme I (PtsP)
VLAASLEWKIHEPGEPVLDAVLAVVAAASSSSMRRDDLLAEVCRQIGGTAVADVVSVYVHEIDTDGEVLVMRANVGFPRAAVGGVTLRMGEGITGVAAARQRPVSACAAPRDPSFKLVPGLGEERFPVMLATPISHHGRVVGVLVLQRRVRAFDPSEIAMTSALAAVVSTVISRPRLGSVSLDGCGVSSGTALGTATPLPGLTAFAQELRAHPLPAHHDIAIVRSLDAVERELSAGARRLRSIDRATRQAWLAETRLLSDERMRDALRCDVADRGLLDGVLSVARRYAVAPYRVPSPADAASMAFVARRARELEDMCLLVLAHLAGRSLLAPSAIVISPTAPTLGLALSLVARRAGGLVVTAPVDADAPGALVLRAAGVPIVADVDGLARWCQPGDPLLVDGDQGVVRVHPSSAEVVAKRRRLAAIQARRGRDRDRE